MHCFALTAQQNLRDLIQLPKLVNNLDWIEADKFLLEPGLAVISGLWVQDGGPEVAERILRRSELGHATLLVPRFKAGNLGVLFGAPTAIDVCPGDFNELEWSHGNPYVVSGVSHFKTALHAGKWATATGNEIVILCYRPHAAAGAIVLCSVALTARLPGVKFEEQKRLFDQILSALSELNTQPTSAAVMPQKKDDIVLDADAFLEEYGEQGASLLFALIASDGYRNADLAAHTAQSIGLHLTSETLSLSSRLKETPLPEIEAALRNHGWGAYLRRLVTQMQNDNPRR